MILALLLGVMATIPIYTPFDAPSEVRVSISGIGPYKDDDWKFENTSDIIPTRDEKFAIFIESERKIIKAGEKGLFMY